MTVLGKRVPVPIVPGIMPYEDSTALDTLYFTDADKIRFQNGKLRKLRGWQRIFFDNFQRLRGAVRNIFSYYDQNDNPITVIGTNACLYAFINDALYNITPLQTTNTAIANSIATEYNSGVNVNITTTINSPIVTLNITNYFNSLDNITISGVGVAVNGIPAGNFNNTFSVNVISNTQIEINVGANATSSGTVSVNLTWAASYVYVTWTGNNLFKGDRIKLAGIAGNPGGIPDASLNIENYITNIVNENVFTIQTDTIATSSVSNAGGGAVVIYKQITAGNANQGTNFGFGSGYFGMGLYGVSENETPTTEPVLPRIWSMDLFGNQLILTPGDPSSNTTDNLYIWSNDVTTAPVLISSLGSASHVPLAVVWVYVSHGSVVVLGATQNYGGAGQPKAGLTNFITSDIGNVDNNWTPGPSTYAYSTTLYNASPFISQASSRNRDLLFTHNEVYLAEFVDKPFIWNITKLFTSDGLIGPKARTEVEDAVFWMGNGDFFIFDGTSVNIVPNNTVKRFVYDNINYGQSHKVVAFLDSDYTEIWWIIPLFNDIEPNHYVKYNYKEGVWDLGTISRTAAEEPQNVLDYPLMVESQITKTLEFANNLNTFFYALGSDPLSTTNTSQNVKVTINSTAWLNVGDKVKISGAVDTNGILAAQINGIQTITAITYSGNTITDFTFVSAGTATSTGTGGGNAITVGTNIVGLNWGSLPGLNIGDTININGAQSIGGLTSGLLNGQFTIRMIIGNVLQYQVISPDINFSTSSVSNGGGLAITVSYTSSARLFQHEVGFDDYNPDYNPNTDPWYNQYAPMNSFVQTNYAQIDEGDNTMIIYSVYPDINLRVENQSPGPVLPQLTLTVNGQEYAQQSASVTVRGPYTITPTTSKIDVMLIARQRQYIIECNELGADFIIGKWIEEVKPSSTR